MEDAIPEWPCPTCNKGFLRKKNFLFQESFLSQSLYSTDAWEPEFSEFVCTSLLLWSKAACKEVVVNVGASTVDWDMLLAIKWLGNAGSHGHGKITIDDVMDSYELTEHILAEIFEPKIKKLKAIAKKINRKKGP